MWHIQKLPASCWHSPHCGRVEHTCSRVLVVDLYRFVLSVFLGVTSEACKAFGAALQLQLEGGVIEHWSNLRVAATVSSIISGKSFWSRSNVDMPIFYLLQHDCVLWPNIYIDRATRQFPQHKKTLISNICLNISYLGGDAFYPSRKGLLARPCSTMMAFISEHPN